MESKSSENRAAAPEETRSDVDIDGLPGRIARLEERFLQLDTEVRGEFSALRNDLHRLAETLRIEIRAGDGETRRYMRVLHEEVLSRIGAVRRR